LVLEGQSLKYSVNMLTCTLFYDTGPSCLIRSIRTVYKYRKCSFLTGLLTSLTDLLQANHQGQIGTSKTKSTGSPVPPRSLCSFLYFAFAESFFFVFSGSLFAGYQTHVISVGSISSSWLEFTHDFFSLYSSDCLKNGRPSTLVGDIFFDLTCAACSSDGLESCTRQALSW